VAASGAALLPWTKKTFVVFNDRDNELPDEEALEIEKKNRERRRAESRNSKFRLS